MLHRRTLVLPLLLLAACSFSRNTELTAVGYDDLPGWQGDHQAEALQVFVDSCAANAKKPHPWVDKNNEQIGDPAAWQSICDAASQLPSPTDAQARAFFEAHFMPVRVETGWAPHGSITGYYEPVIHGSMVQGGVYQTPVYGLPGEADRHASRAEIDAGALVGKAPVLLYVDDPVMLFFMQIQGSGKVLLPDGSMVGLQYAGRNGYDYIAIGKRMKQAGQLSEVSMQTIRDWLHDHPQDAPKVMEQNPSYIYFSLADGTAYARGAQGLPLTPQRSIAIDDDRAAYGVPTYIVTRQPAKHTFWGSVPYRRLFIAQDTGGALHGPHRADIFYGRGEEAEWTAGQQDSKARVYWLLPKGTALLEEGLPAAQIGGAALPQTPAIP